MLKVLVLNDRVTPMSFAVLVLQQVFDQSKEEAEITALHAHLNGDALCGIYQQQAEAQAAVEKARELSSKHDYPLDFSIVPIPFRERAAVWIFGMVMKVAPAYP